MKIFLLTVFLFAIAVTKGTVFKEYEDGKP